MKNDLKTKATTAAGMFMDIPTEKPTETAEQEAPAAVPGIVPPMEKAETKTRRVNLLLKPSIYDAVSKAAAASGRKVNDYINYVLESYTKGN